MRPDIEQEVQLVATRILGLQDNWDDEGAVAITKDTWNLSVEVLNTLVEQVFERTRIAIPVPDIGGCADGSVDLYWHEPDFTLLINVAAGREVPSDYYLAARGQKLESGVFDAAALKLICTWLAKLLTTAAYPAPKA